uniref:Galaxin-like repeats domain-containing protein n=1 Tax=Plectus sambesii TaxID=2011161 RepID=A0A914UW41_9BILA
MTLASNIAVLLPLCLYILHTHQQPQQLVISACCGTTAANCLNYSNAEDLFGLSCCGTRPINQFEEICCNNVARKRRQGNKYYEQCCGDQVLGYDETCCSNVVHRIANQQCCGNQTFNMYDQRKLCCDGVLSEIPEGKIGACCGSRAFDGGVNQFCCAGSVSNRSTSDSCCMRFRANETDPIAGQPYNSATHFCCDTPFPIAGNQACCYVRRTGGDADPLDKPMVYDTTRQCCSFPFKQPMPKPANNDCSTVGLV